jgi:nitroreductase/NAD-dependent dihydropyrimidine dehydrogenase PreA subunit
VTEKTTYAIDTDICIRCDLCRKECPAAAIKDSQGKLAILDDRCIECGHCGAVCPEGAVLCDGESLAPLENHGISGAQAFSLIGGKRSVRSYSDMPIPSEVLDRILETGALAATATNSRNVRARVFSEGEVSLLASRLCAALLGTLNLIDTPPGRLIARLAGMKRYADPSFLKAFKRKMAAGAEGTGDPLFFKAPAVVVVTYPRRDTRFGRTNAVLAGQSMMLYAHALGIESCVIGFAEAAGKRDRGKQALGVGRDREIGLIFTLGYGKPRYHRLPKRPPLERE